MLQDTYNWAAGKSSDAADKASSAAKDTEKDASGKASSLKSDADKEASKAKSEAKGYVQSASDATKVRSKQCLGLVTWTSSTPGLLLNSLGGSYWHRQHLAAALVRGACIWSGRTKDAQMPD